MAMEERQEKKKKKGAAVFKNKEKSLNCQKHSQWRDVVVVPDSARCWV